MKSFKALASNLAISVMSWEYQGVKMQSNWLSGSIITLQPK
jgi:hypothetical protein